MSERAPRHLSNGAAKRERHEVARLAEVEHIIHKKAHKFSNDKPMLAEDLAQQAREAVIKQLRKHPDCPTSHLVVKLSAAIYDYLRLGSSVDGKLNPQGRARNYQLTRLDAPLEGEDSSTEPTLFGEVISDPREPRRYTEERALTNTLVDRARGQLSAEDNTALTLRLQGFTWREVGQMLHHNQSSLIQAKKRLREVFRLGGGQAEIGNPDERVNGRGGP